MKKLTDRIVAIALGYKITKEWRKGRLVRVLHRVRGGCNQLIPPFTTSLDAIVAEVEARGLWWSVGKITAAPYLAAVSRTYDASDCREVGATAPLALCAALLAYLKEGA